MGGNCAGRLWLAALAWSVAGLVPGAEPGQQQSLDDEVLDEVLVEGRRIVPKRRSFKELQKPFNWLARLVGEFEIDGSVDLHAQDRPEDLRSVSGRAHCVGFGLGPGVQCDLTVRWQETKGPDGQDIPGGVSTLNPAVMLLGFEPVLPGVSYILVDNQGNADIAVGEMVTVDTMFSRSKCIDIAGDCERLMQLTAGEDLESVKMKIDLRIDGESAVGFSFSMRRVPGTVSVVYGRKQGKKR